MKMYRMRKRTKSPVKKIVNENRSPEALLG
jgi:hypothetical protein